MGDLPPSERDTGTSSPMPSGTCQVVLDFEDRVGPAPVSAHRFSGDARSPWKASLTGLGGGLVEIKLDRVLSSVLHNRNLRVWGLARHDEVSILKHLALPIGVSKLRNRSFQQVDAIQNGGIDLSI